MSRAALVALLLAVTAASLLIAGFRLGAKPVLSEEQRALREKFFGSGGEPPPIKDGQEMRPRW